MFKKKNTALSKALLTGDNDLTNRRPLFPGSQSGHASDSNSCSFFPEPETSSYTAETSVKVNSELHKILLIKTASHLPTASFEPGSVNAQILSSTSYSLPLTFFLSFFFFFFDLILFIFGCVGFSLLRTGFL